MEVILIISPEPWNAHHVSKHHYSQALASKGFKILFLEPPDSSLSEYQIIQVEENPRIHLLQGPPLARGLRFYPPFLVNLVQSKWLLKIESLIDKDISVVWLFENSRFFNLRFATNRLKIYHQVDLNQNFQPRIAASTADICFCTTDIILKKLLKYSSSVYKIHHGLAPIYKKSQLCADKLRVLQSHRINAAYIGNLDFPYLDHQLLASVIKQNPEVFFHLVGNISESSSFFIELKAYSNVLFWGKISSSLIPSLLDKVDINIVCYKHSHQEDQASPHKFMEYLASGKIIISTYTAEYRDKSNLLAMSPSQSNEHYPSLFKSVADNLIYWNDPIRMLERRKFANDNTYLRQLECINTHLLRNNLPPVD